MKVYYLTDNNNCDNLHDLFFMRDQVHALPGGINRFVKKFCCFLIAYTCQRQKDLPSLCACTLLHNAWSKTFVHVYSDKGKLSLWYNCWFRSYLSSHYVRVNQQRQYFMHDQCLEVVCQEKDLGILISNDLKVSQQCQQAYNKASRILGLINRTIEYKHTDNFFISTL